MRLGQFRDVRDLVGILVEDQFDLHACQVGADAVVRAVAAKAQVRVGITQDVELERPVEDALVVIRGAVEQAGALAARMVTPPSSASASAVRWKQCTGVAQRFSVAVGLDQPGDDVVGRASPRCSSAML